MARLGPVTGHTLAQHPMIIDSYKLLLEILITAAAIVLGFFATSIMIDPVYLCPFGAMATYLWAAWCMNRINCILPPVMPGSD